MVANEIMHKEAVVANPKKVLSIFLEGLKKAAKKKLSHDIRFPDRDSNPGPPE
jgi:hypothetical protein